MRASTFVVVLSILVAALLGAAAAESSRANGLVARVDARVQGLPPRKLLQAPAPVEAPAQVLEEESTPEATTPGDADADAVDAANVADVTDAADDANNDADEYGLSSDEPTTDPVQSTSPVTVVQESFSAPAGNDNEAEETSTSTATTTTSDSLSGLATSTADGVNSASEEEEEEGSAPSSTTGTTDSLSGLATGTADDVAMADDVALPLASASEE